MELQKLGLDPRWTKGRVEIERVAKQRVVQRVCSWIVQNVLRSVLNRMTTGTV